MKEWQWNSKIHSTKRSLGNNLESPTLTQWHLGKSGARVPCCRFLSCSFSSFQFSVNTFVYYPRVKKNALKYRKSFILACFDCQEMERERKWMCFGDFAVLFSLKLSGKSMYFYSYLCRMQSSFFFSVLADETSVKKCTDQFVVCKHKDLSKSFLCFWELFRGALGNI